MGSLPGHSVVKGSPGPFFKRSPSGRKGQSQSHRGVLFFFLARFVSMALISLFLTQVSFLSFLGLARGWPLRWHPAPFEIPEESPEPPGPAPGPTPPARRPSPIGLFVHRPRCHWLSLCPRSPPPPSAPLRPFSGGRGRGGAAQKGGAIGGRDRASCPAPPGPSSQARVSQPQQQPLRGGRTELRRSNQRLNPREQVSERCWAAPHLSISRGPRGRSLCFSRSLCPDNPPSISIPASVSISLSLLSFPLSLLLCGSGEADLICLLPTPRMGSALRPEHTQQQGL